MIHTASTAFIALSLATVLSGADGAVAVVAKLVEVVARPMQGSTVLPGELQPFRGVAIGARVSGFVESVAVDRGSAVGKGDLLATISAPEMNARLAEAKARVVAVTSESAGAQAKAAGLTSTLNRLREAARTPGVVAGNEVDLAARALEAEQARIASIGKSAKAAQASVASLEELMKYLRVTAEFDGVVTARFVHEGSLVGPESGSGPMFRLEQIDKLRLVVAVPESLAGGIRKGIRVAFTVAAFPGQPFQGTVARPAYSLDPKTRTMPVELDVANPHSRLAPGMYAEVAWPMARGGLSLLVPPKAIKSTTERIFVIRVTNGVTEWVDVRRGAASGDLVEVFGKLRAGDRIFESASDEVRPGTPVTAQ